MKLLTISIAAYNVEKYIDYALDSIIKSKYIDDIEVIVVNDGSKDKTLEIAKKYEKLYKNSIIVVDKINSGYGSTINASLKIATGKYFKLLDGDDFFNVAELDKLIDILKTTEVDMFVNDYFVYSEWNKYFKKINIINVETNKILPIFNIYNYGLNPGMTIKTEILKNNNIKITENCFYTDTEYVLKSLLVSKNFMYVNISPYNYRIGRVGQSVSIEGRIKHIDDHEFIVKEIATIVFNNTSDDNKNLYDYTYSLLIDHFLNYYLYCEPNNDNLKKFIDYCRYLKEDIKIPYSYFTKKQLKILNKPSKYYKKVAKFNRFKVKVKKVIKKILWKK